MSQYVRHRGCGETVLIHVRERLDERDSTESFLDIGDVVRGRPRRPEHAGRR